MGAWWKCRVAAGVRVAAVLLLVVALAVALHLKRADGLRGDDVLDLAHALEPGARGTGFTAVGARTREASRFARRAPR